MPNPSALVRIGPVPSIDGQSEDPMNQHQNRIAFTRNGAAVSNSDFGNAGALQSAALTGASRDRIASLGIAAPPNSGNSRRVISENRAGTRSRRITTPMPNIQAFDSSIVLNTQSGSSSSRNTGSSASLTTNNNKRPGGRRGRSRNQLLSLGSLSSAGTGSVGNTFGSELSATGSQSGTQSVSDPTVRSRCPDKLTSGSNDSKNSQSSSIISGGSWDSSTGFGDLTPNTGPTFQTDPSFQINPIIQPGPTLETGPAILPDPTLEIDPTIANPFEF